MALGYFFDSYAVIELTKGNPRYAKYSEAVVTLTLFNIVEIVYSARQELGEEKAGQVYDQFIDCVQDVDKAMIMEALELKRKYKKRDLSYTDCIGYAFARQRNLRFLTGDSKFEDLENVEFVK